MENNFQITCPHCNSNKISKTVLYKRSIFWRLVFIAAISVFIYQIVCFPQHVFAEFLEGNASIILDEDKTDLHQKIILASGAICIVAKIIQTFIESKTKIHYICKECNLTWTTPM